jgi:hypothetical protein
MSEWGRDTFGDPCRQCGFRWTITRDDAVALVSAAPDELARVLRHADGSERHGERAWPVVGYVCHMADNLRIWAERLVGLVSGDRRPVAPYDQDELARTRGYPEIALGGALWSLGRAVGDWTDAVRLADDAPITLVHPHRGPQSLVDVVRTNSHDVGHHCWDIQRAIDDTVS